MEKKVSKKREKRMRLEEIIPDDSLRNEMLSRLYKGDPILGEKGVFTNLLQTFVNAALEHLNPCEAQLAHYPYRLPEIGQEITNQ